MSKKKTRNEIIPIELVNQVQMEMVNRLENEPEYSLEADPTGRLGFTNTQKEFVKHYVNFKNVPTASQLSGLTEEEGKDLWLDPAIQSEIRRINLALYQRKFSKRLLTVDELGGYLTSLLIEDDITIGERLDPKDKLQVVKMMIDLNKDKQKILENEVEEVDLTKVEKDIQKLDVDSLKNLLNKKKSEDEMKSDEEKRHQLLDEIKATSYLTSEEEMLLEKSTLEELEEIMKGRE